MIRAAAATTAAILVGAACATSGGGGGSSGFAGGDGGDQEASFSFDGPVEAPFTGCGTATYKAQQSPAAMLVVLDASGTMAAQNKYAYAEQAIIAAIDQDAFDTVALGLLLYPSGTVPGPECAFGLPVACKVSGLAQVPLTMAGPLKSNAATGVRREIYNQLSNSEPNKTGFGDGNPTYDALTIGYSALKSLPLNGKRILLYITDGGASCTSLASPSRPSYQDANNCPDWENPGNLVTLIKAAHDDATSIATFIVGVPGADTNGSDPTTQPPYHVRNALSAYAFAGSPETVDPACTGKAYSQTGPDPTVSCHFDMTQQYTAQMLGDAINQIRGKVLGCVFELPVPEAGTIDKTLVNVEYSVGGGADNPLYKRKDASNSCDPDGCWDYTADGKVELFGKACTDVKTATDAKVQIVVGCATIVK